MRVHLAYFLSEALMAYYVPVFIHMNLLKIIIFITFNKVIWTYSKTNQITQTCHYDSHIDERMDNVVHV